MKKQSIFIILLFLAAGIVIAVPQITNLLQTIPYGNCGDTDAISNLYDQFATRGTIAGIFNGTLLNQTGQFSGVYTDYCQDSQILVEFACGSSFSQQYSNFAGTINFNCSEAGNYVCSNGACIVNPTNSTIYDDFSSGQLNTSKWLELSTGLSANPFIDEHFVSNHSGGVYHTAQLIPEDRGVTLEIKQHVFVAGDTLEFDLSYINGSGNRMNYIDINRQTYNYGAIGYWNGIEAGGNDFGQYHWKIRFTQSGINMSLTKPNGTTIQIQQFPPFTALNYTVGFGTRTGDNGLVHIDYDNVLIY